jgi:hypothetical protein
MDNPYIIGWINGFHHWTSSGGLLTQKGGPSSVSLDNTAYSSRMVIDLPIAYPTILVRA